MIITFVGTETYVAYIKANGVMVLTNVTIQMTRKATARVSYILALCYHTKYSNIITDINYVLVRSQMNFVYLGMSTCPEYQFTCKNKRCVANSKKCDGNNDCGDFSDEIYPCSGRNKQYIFTFCVTTNSII